MNIGAVFWLSAKETDQNIITVIYIWHRPVHNVIEERACSMDIELLRVFM